MRMARPLGWKPPRQPALPPCPKSASCASTAIRWGWQIPRPRRKKTLWGWTTSRSTKVRKKTHLPRPTSSKSAQIKSKSWVCARRPQHCGYWTKPCVRLAASSLTSGASPPSRPSSKATWKNCWSTPPVRVSPGVRCCLKPIARSWWRHSANMPSPRRACRPWLRPARMRKRACSNWPKPAWRACAIGM